MKKGFLFSLSISLLFLLLISLAFNIQKSSINEQNMINENIASKKILYSFNDIAKEIELGIFGINISKNETNLTIGDYLPAEFDILQTLVDSVEFIEENYRTNDMEILFLNDIGDEFEIIDLDPWISIEPWNIKYQYEDWGKRELMFSCPEQNCSKIIRFNLTIITNNTFDYPPIPSNKNKYKWAPSHLRNNCAGQTDCLEFELYVQDAEGQVFSCPGPVCNYGAYDLTKRSALQISSSPCWLSIQVGGSAWESGYYRVYEIKSHSPNNPNQECAMDFEVINSIEFEDSNYTVNLPLILKVNEVNYNISKEEHIYGENE